MKTERRTRIDEAIEALKKGIANGNTNIAIDDLCSFLAFEIDEAELLGRQEGYERGMEKGVGIKDHIDKSQ